MNDNNNEKIMPQMYQLKENFRTHCGVVNIANSIVELVMHFFPTTIDKLDPETSRVMGPVPIFINEKNDLIYDLFNNDEGKQHNNSNIVNKMGSSNNINDSKNTIDSDDDSNNSENINNNSNSNNNSMNKSCEFGAEQVILVKDDETKAQLIGIIGNKALVLTVLESKGMEFTDCLIYNFFKSSLLKNVWRVLYNKV
jgi:hypothetical protein